MLIDTKMFKFNSINILFLTKFNLTKDIIYHTNSLLLNISHIISLNSPRNNLSLQHINLLKQKIFKLIPKRTLQFIMRIL